MQQLRWMLNGALITLAFCLLITLTILLLSELQPVRADLVIQPAATIEENPAYLRLTGAPPERDITAQRFAPLEVNR